LMILNGREKVSNFTKFYLIFIKQKYPNVLSTNKEKIMKDLNNLCLFCNPKKSGLACENDFAYASYDSYPVTNDHCLIIPKRHIKNYFQLTNEEVIACYQLIKKIKNEVEKKDSLVKGFNVGTNAGKVAGQSIMHCHIHLIPRRKGDVKNSQGGVRSVIPLKQHYIRKA